MTVYTEEGYDLFSLRNFIKYFYIQAYRSKLLRKQNKTTTMLRVNVTLVGQQLMSRLSNVNMTDCVDWLKHSAHRHASRSQTKG